MTYISCSKSWNNNVMVHEWVMYYLHNITEIVGKKGFWLSMEGYKNTEATTLVQRTWCGGVDSSMQAKNVSSVKKLLSISVSHQPRVVECIAWCCKCLNPLNLNCRWDLGLMYLSLCKRSGIHRIKFCTTFTQKYSMKMAFYQPRSGMVLGWVRLWWFLGRLAF